MKYVKTIIITIAEANGDDDYTLDEIKTALQFPADDNKQFNVIDIREESAF